MRYMEDAPRRDVLNRLKTSRGHIDGIIRMVEDDTTPGSSSRVSSMRRLQLVQCMPVTTSVICSANVLFS